MQNLHSIKPIGSFFKMTEEGHVVNPTSMRLIPLKWQLLINQVKVKIIEKFGTELHSIYLRGSVARGEGIDGFADLDIFVLLNSPDLRWKVADWLPEYHQYWKQDFPFVKEVEVMCSSFSENMYLSNHRLAMLIKTQSLLLFGPDISTSIPSFMPSKEMMLNFRWLEKDLQAFFAKAKPQANDVQEIAKVMIRSGFELVMEREGKYTTDLFLCYQTFSTYYPERSVEMKSILYFYLNPEEGLELMCSLLRNIGEWLVLEIKRII